MELKRRMRLTHLQWVQQALPERVCSVGHGCAGSRSLYHLVIKVSTLILSFSSFYESSIFRALFLCAIKPTPSLHDGAVSNAPI